MGAANPLGKGAGKNFTAELMRANSQEEIDEGKFTKQKRGVVFQVERRPGARCAGTRRPTVLCLAEAARG